MTSMRSRKTKPQLDGRTEQGQGRGFAFCSKTDCVGQAVQKLSAVKICKDKPKLLPGHIYFDFLELGTICSRRCDFRKSRKILTRFLWLSSRFSGPCRSVE